MGKCPLTQNSIYNHTTIYCDDRLYMVIQTAHDNDRHTRSQNIYTHTLSLQPFTRNYWKGYSAKWGCSNRKQIITHLLESPTSLPSWSCHRSFLVYTLCFYCWHPSWILYSLNMSVGVSSHARNYLYIILSYLTTPLWVIHYYPRFMEKEIEIQRG